MQTSIVVPVSEFRKRFSYYVKEIINKNIIIYIKRWKRVIAKIVKVDNVEK